MSEARKTNVRRQRSIYQVHYSLRPRDDLTKPLFADMDVQQYGTQVAGHCGNDGDKYTGLLQCSNGTLLKPILKESQRKEVEFYERLANTQDKDLLELKSFVPQYYGCKRYTYNGYEQEYIILEDLSFRMLQPCVLDVKIGRRTWDDDASPAKIAAEQAKYARCKQQYGFCVPGFQVYDAAGRRHRYGKEHGKKLHGPAVVDALRQWCGRRRLPVRLALSALWRLQRVAARVTARVTLRAASLLLLYDAAHVARSPAARSPAARSPAARSPAARSGHSCTQNSLSGPIPRRKSFHSLHSLDNLSFSGQLSPKGPVFQKVNSFPLTSALQQEFAPPPPVTSPWSEALDRLKKNHSFEHNYESNLSKIKMEYRATLDQLCNESPHPASWVTVKLIDFAHATFNEEHDTSPDENFKEGLDSLVNIFEMLLEETDDQVF